MIFIHDTAIVDEGAKIGEGSKVWHFSHIMKEAIIGKNCILGQNVFVASGVSLGNNVKVQNNVSIYDGVVTEDDVFLGPSMVFTNVINPRSFIERKEEFKTTLVKKGATIGANATIVCGNNIGKYGNPGHQIGWVSKSGLRLDFDYTGKAVCPHSGETYHLDGNKVYGE